MILALFLALGDSFSDMRKTGQNEQFLKFYLPTFSIEFDKVYIFSYAKENVKELPKNVKLVDNSTGLHRYLYALLLPFLHRKIIKNSDVIRAYHVTGAVPAIIAKLIYRKPFIFNYAFNYQKFALLEKKYHQVFLLYLVEPLAFLMTDKVFIASKRYLTKSKKSVYLPNGVNTNFFKPNKEKHKGSASRIISVGRLTPQKNLHLLISSIKGLKARLTIIGTGPLKSSLVNHAKDLGVKLSIIEYVPNNVMPKIYNGADVFVLPSLMEGHPKALLEAMACALPVIGTNVEGTNEIINDGINGLIAKPTETAIRSKIKKLVSNYKLASELSRAARTDVVSNFNLSVLIRKEINTIKSLK